MNKYFPIKTETACQLKWTWSTVYLYNGTTNSCHRVGKTDFDVDDFKSFHNTPKKIADRELMLDGQWPAGGCEYCRKIEDAGGSSDRMLHLQIPDLTPPELDHDPHAVTVTPRIVEVYFDNVCNMSCIYCSDVFSSKIQHENKKFGRFEKNGLVIDNYTTKHNRFSEITEKFWQWMDDNYSTIRRLHILGGEPFYQQQFDICLDFLYNRVNADLEFNIVSNLMIDPEKFKQQIYRIKDLVSKRKIKRFDLTASIDCWGAEQEYIRHGLDLEQWRKNFEFLVSERWITLNVNQTLSALSIPSTVELIKYVNQQRQTRKIGQYFMTVTEPSYLNPDIFGRNYFAQHFDAILSAMPTGDWSLEEAKKYMAGIKSQVTSADKNLNEIVKLRTYLDELDRRRNQSWRTTFPWLTEVLDNVV